MCFLIYLIGRSLLSQLSTSNSKASQKQSIQQPKSLSATAMNQPQKSISNEINQQIGSFAGCGSIYARRGDGPMAMAFYRIKVVALKSGERPLLLVGIIIFLFRVKSFAPVANFAAINFSTSALLNTWKMHFFHYTLQDLTLDLARIFSTGSHCVVYQQTCQNYYHNSITHIPMVLSKMMPITQVNIQFISVYLRSVRKLTISCSTIFRVYTSKCKNSEIKTQYLQYENVLVFVGIISVFFTSLCDLEYLENKAN